MTWDNLLRFLMMFEMRLRSPKANNESQYDLGNARIWGIGDLETEPLSWPVMPSLAQLRMIEGYFLKFTWLFSSFLPPFLPFFLSLLTFFECIWIFIACISVHYKYAWCPQKPLLTTEPVRETWISWK